MNQTLSKKQLSEAIFEQLKKSVGQDLEFFQIFKNVKGTRFTSTGFELAKSLWRVYPIKF
jgi:hypothetical protein